MTLVRRTSLDGTTVIYEECENGDLKIYPSVTYWKNKYNENWYFNLLKSLLERKSNTHKQVLDGIDKFFNLNPNDTFIRVIYVGVDEVFDGENVVISMIVKKDHYGNYTYELESSHEGFVLHKIDIKEFNQDIFDKEDYLDGFSKALHKITLDKSKSALDLPEDVYEDKYRLVPDTSLDVLDYYYIYDGKRPLFGAGASLVFDISDSNNGLKATYDNKCVVLPPNNTILVVSEWLINIPTN